jgi:hypothetical protein
MVVLNIRLSLDVDSTAATDGSNSEIVADMPINSFNQWVGQVLSRKADLFLLPCGMPPASPNDFHIVTDPLAKAPYCQPYRQSLAEQKANEIELHCLVINGWVTDSYSRFGGQIIFVNKGNGERYMCVDYRGLNAITAHDQFLLPYIDDFLNKLHSTKYFLKLNMLSRYHQLCI